MAIPTSAIALSLIQGEFGGENPISLSEYYRSIPPALVYVTSTYVRPEVTSVPLSGTISFGTFAGVSQPVPNTSKIGIVQDGFIFKGNPPINKSLVAEVSVTGSPNIGGPLKNRYVNVSGLLYNKPVKNFIQTNEGAFSFLVSTNVPASTSDFTNITVTNNLGTFSISRASMTAIFTSGSERRMTYQAPATNNFLYNVTAGTSVIVCIN
jgi:hypothetical protein